MADAVIATKQSKGTTKYACGTPYQHCGGGIGQVSHALIGKVKLHSSPQQAFNCHVKYLISQGYEKVGAREYKAPDGSGIRVLTRKSRFGSPMRPGKAGRNMPPSPKGGLITTC